MGNNIPIGTVLQVDYTFYIWTLKTKLKPLEFHTKTVFSQSVINPSTCTVQPCLTSVSVEHDP